MFTKLQDLFLDVDFNKESHNYQVSNEKFISVTTLLNLYKPKVDFEKIAVDCSIRNKISKEELQKQWNNQSQLAVKRGNYIHSYIENFLKHQNFKEENEYRNLIQQFLDFSKDFLTDKKLIYSEKILYSKDDKIAGTIDCLLFSYSENCFYFIDWKTNQVINMKSKYQQNLCFPISTYDDCSYNIYSLQLSFYRYIFEKELLNKSILVDMSSEYKAKNLIIQFSEKNSTYCIYETPYLKYSVIQILNHYNKTKGN